MLSGRDDFWIFVGLPSNLYPSGDDVRKMANLVVPVQNFRETDIFAFSPNINDLVFKDTVSISLCLSHKRQCTSMMLVMSFPLAGTN